jgi:hypothetical protein
MQAMLLDRVALDPLDRVLTISKMAEVSMRAASSDKWQGELIGNISAYSETQTARNYRFECPSCNYDWATWLKPSITFVSLSFVTDDCPNCYKKYVQACASNGR